MSDAVLSIEGLTAGYDGAPVIRDIDLRVGAGEVVALLGPNGAGKTTTLKAVSGLVRPLRGRIVLELERYMLERTPTLRSFAKVVRSADATRSEIESCNSKMSGAFWLN